MRTIVHLSDLHFGRVDMRLIEALTSVVTATNPDLVAVSGDLTQRARPTQFLEARAFLDRLPFPRLVVPGNHDISLYNPLARFINPLDRYRRFITDDLAPMFADDEMVVVGLNSARSAVMAGRGRLSAQQVARAAERLRSVPPGHLRIVVTHHPFDLPETYLAAHLVGRSQMAMTALAPAGADVFLAGHLHVSHVGRTALRYRIAGHDALVVQAGTMSTRVRGEGNTFNVLTVSSGDVRITRHSWDADRSVFVAAPAGRYRKTGDGWTTIEP
jgi:3',5'-cyclic AMP phosphodiesterase CpdA